MKRTAFVLLWVVAVCAVAEAQTTIYLKRDHIYAGPGGGEIAIVTPPNSDTTAPTAPSSLGTTSTTATSVGLSWTGSTDSGGSGLAGYKIMRQKGSGASLPVGTVNSSTTAFLDQPLVPNASYTYTIIAFDAAQNHSSASNSVNPTTSAASSDTTAPNAPTGLRGIPTTRQSTYKVRLDWDAATDAGGSGISGYKVYRDSTLISGGSLVTNRYYEDSSNTANTAFSYKVKAVDGQGNESGYSSTISVTTLRYGLFYNFNQADQSGIDGLYVRSNTLQRVGPHDNCGWTMDMPPVYLCYWDAYLPSSESSFKLTVKVLGRGSFYAGAEIWRAGDAAYRAYLASNGYLYLDYWPTLDPSEAVGLAYAAPPAGSGTLSVDADSATRRIKVYWNGTLLVDFTDSNTSRANSGNVGVSSLGGGEVERSIFDDLLVEH